MADEYTPTTEQVRNDFATRMAPVRDDARRAAFDRWLAAHDRDTAARAWDEGAKAAWESSGEGWNGEYPPGTEHDIPNPYREEDRRG